MRILLLLLLLALAACGKKTVDEDVRERRPRVQAMLDTIDVALVRSYNEKTVDAVDIDAVARGDVAATIPNELRKAHPLPILATRPGFAEDSPAGRCQKILIAAGRGDVTRADVPLADIKAALQACEVRYIEVIERDDDPGREQYVNSYGGPSTPLSRGGTFEIFDVTDQKRVVSVRFPIREAPPTSMSETDATEIDHERLYRAADDAFKKLIAAKPATR
jgi:hypothetical protein